MNFMYNSPVKLINNGEVLDCTAFLRRLSEESLKKDRYPTVRRISIDDIEFPYEKQNQDHESKTGTIDLEHEK